MNFEDFSPENIDLRAIKVEEAYGALANAFFAQFETEDFTESDVDFFADKKVEWFDVKSDVLGGMTPREYIAENWGEKPDFDAAVTLVKPFFFDDNYDVPKELADLIKSFPEFIAWAADFIEMLKTSARKGDYILPTSAFYALLAGNDDEILIKKTLELLDLLEYNENNEIVFDSAAFFLALSESGIKAITEKSNSEAPSDKTFTLLSNAASSEYKSDGLYVAIRSFCKRATGKFTPDCYYLFLDYGDARAVSFLRTQAKKYRELWLSGENTDENRNAYFTLVDIIAELGGNTEDFL